MFPSVLSQVWNEECVLFDSGAASRLHRILYKCLVYCLELSPPGLVLKGFPDQWQRTSRLLHSRRSERGKDNFIRTYLDTRPWRSQPHPNQHPRPHYLTASLTHLKPRLPLTKLELWLHSPEPPIPNAVGNLGRNAPSARFRAGDTGPTSRNRGRTDDLTLSRTTFDRDRGVRFLRTRCARSDTR